jgi:putative endopeptidase
MRKDSNVNRLYNSYYNFKDNIVSSEFRIRKMISYLDTLRKDKNNLWKYLAHCTKYRISHPFFWALQIDNKNTTKYKVILGENGLGLSDKNHYTKRGKSIEIREEYVKYIDKSFELLMGNKNELDSKNVLKIETYIAKITRNEIDSRNPELTYNPYSISELCKLGFNAKEYFNEIGYSKLPESVIVTNPKYFRMISKFLKNWNSDEWYSYWVFKIFNSYCRFHMEWREHEFKFYENYLMGQKEITTPDKIAIRNGVTMILNTRLTNEYMKKHLEKDNITYCRLLFEKIRTVFRKRLEHSCWLSPETIVSGIKKLDCMELHCGMKKKFIADPNIKFRDDDVIYNYFQYRKYYINNQIKKTFKPVDKAEWDRFDSENIFDVNAYYFPLTNEIVIPNAILQKPFIDHKKNMAYNLAYLGSTIAHEMIHAFDDEGAKYDYKGEWKNWWSKNDMKKYKDKQKSVVRQYENYAKKIDDFKLSGEFSLGENIADIGGLAIAEETLLEYLKECRTPELKIDDHLKMFFVYYVEQWRTKIKKQAKHELSGTDEHVNPKYRANMSLSRSDNFRRLFDIKNGDLMYWYDSDQIW